MFGQATEAGIQPPTDLSLGSILQFVLDILGLSMDMIWERLALKIGEERVEQIKTAINFLTGAWEWISVALNDGPGALWEMIQSQISGLWTTIINAAMQWIMVKIIEKATIWLLGFLDPTFIMAVVNSLIILYKAVESFVQYITEMLEIINTVLNGIGEIAAGAIAGAANYLENALAESLPIVIGFLANQFGLGKMGKKLAEIIETVREYVVKGIDWLIDKALAVGQGVLNTLGFGGGQGETTTAADGEDKPETPEEEEAGELIVSEPFTMQNTPHTLTARVDENGHLEIFMASRFATKLQEALLSAIRQVKSTLGSNTIKAGMLEDLERLETRLQPHATPMELPMTRRDRVWIDQQVSAISLMLYEYAKEWNLHDLIEVMEDPTVPDIRYLPKGYDVRGNCTLRAAGMKYYASRFWITTYRIYRPTQRRPCKHSRQQAIRLFFKTMIREGRLPLGSDPATFNLATIPGSEAQNPSPDQAGSSSFIYYNVDHVLPLAVHWQNPGFNTNDTQRWQAAGNISGLRR